LSAVDTAGVGWPRGCSSRGRPAEADFAGRPPEIERPSWCHGSPGVARALYLAGSALGEAAWGAAAREALLAVFRRPRESWRMDEPGLCHGRAGLLRITQRLSEDLGDDELEAEATKLAASLVDAFDPDSAFGYPYRDPHRGLTDGPGFLEGAAGTALALHSYARPNAAAPAWDAALLLS
jgi:hypothetical protein